MRSLSVAVRFLTRLPLPAGSPVTTQEMPAATAFFPLVGLLIGATTAGIQLAADLMWPIWIAVALALAFEAWLTGALHEDAVADFFDAFGGGWTREDVLRILKDSRLGSFGALALIILVFLRGATMADLGPLTVPGLMLAAGLGRWSSVLMMAGLQPAGGRRGLADDVGRSVGTVQVALGSLWLLPCLAWVFYLRPEHAIAALGVTALTFVFFRSVLKRRLGGTTGDCLGCLSFLVQLVVLLALVADPVPGILGP